MSERAFWLGIVCGTLTGSGKYEQLERRIDQLEACREY